MVLNFTQKIFTISIFLTFDDSKSNLLCVLDALTKHAILY